MVVDAGLDRYEERLWAQGFSRIVGVDEAGTGRARRAARRRGRRDPAGVRHDRDP